MSDEPTAEVPVSELEALRDQLRDSGPQWVRRILEAADRIVDRIPPAPWEPTDEQIDAYCESRQWGVRNDGTHEHASRTLRAMHDAGFDLALRPKEEEK